MNWRLVLTPYTDDIDTVVAELDQLSAGFTKVVKNYLNVDWEDVVNDFSISTREALMRWREAKMSKASRESSTDKLVPYKNVYKKETLSTGAPLKKDVQIPYLYGQVDWSWCRNNSLTRMTDTDDGIFKEQLSQLEKTLEDRQVVILAGVSGAGKTSLALAFASRRHSVFIEIRFGHSGKLFHGEGYITALRAILSGKNARQVILNDLYARLKCLESLSHKLESPLSWLEAQCGSYNSFIELTIGRYIDSSKTHNIRPLLEAMGYRRDRPLALIIDEAQILHHEQFGFYDDSNGEKTRLLMAHLVALLQEFPIQIVFCGTYVRADMGDSLGSAASVDYDHPIAAFLNFPYVEEPVELIERVVTIPNDSQGNAFKKLCRKMCSGRVRLAAQMMEAILKHYDKRKGSKQLIEILFTYMREATFSLARYIDNLPSSCRKPLNIAHLLQKLIENKDMTIESDGIFNYGILPYKAPKQGYYVLQDVKHCQLHPKVEYYMAPAILKVVGDAYECVSRSITDWNVGNAGNVLDGLIALRMRDLDGESMNAMLKWFGTQLPDRLSDMKIVCNSIAYGVIQESPTKGQFVLPEHFSGADGCLPLELGGHHIGYMTFANTLRGNKVPMEKVKDQLIKVQVPNQYKQAHFKRQKIKDKHYYIRITTELPCRVRELPPLAQESDYGLDLVIDYRNGEAFFGTNVWQWIRNHFKKDPMVNE